MIFWYHGQDGDGVQYEEFIAALDIMDDSAQKKDTMKIAKQMTTLEMKVWGVPYVVDHSQHWCYWPAATIGGSEAIDWMTSLVLGQVDHLTSQVQILVDALGRQS